MILQGTGIAAAKEYLQCHSAVLRDDGRIVENLQSLHLVVCGWCLIAEGAVACIDAGKPTVDLLYMQRMILEVESAAQQLAS